MPTLQQRLAQEAYRAVEDRRAAHAGDEYKRVCQTFPALVHNGGLCQAVAFLQSKVSDQRGQVQHYLDDLAGVLGMESSVLAAHSREAEVLAYQRLTQHVLSAATWLKRYAEALLPSSKDVERRQGGAL